MSYPIPTANNIQPATRPIATVAGEKSNIQKWNEKEGVSFWDFVDVINPLQHIPVVSTIYRGLTGDTIAPMARMAGGALFGGFVGAAIATVNVVSEMKTGRDVGENVVNKLDINIAEKAGIKKPDSENLPVVEVRPIASARPQAPAVVFDESQKPIVLASNGVKEKIIWDDEQATSFASMAPAAGVPSAPKKKGDFDSAFDVAAAMPSAKDLNDLEPGAKPLTDISKKEMPPEVHIPQAMLDAMNKYEKMQQVANAGVIQQDPLKQAVQKELPAPQAMPELAAKQMAAATSVPIPAASARPEMTIASRPAFNNFRRFN